MEKPYKGLRSCSITYHSCSFFSFKGLFFKFLKRTVVTIRTTFSKSRNWTYMPTIWTFDITKLSSTVGTNRSIKSNFFATLLAKNFKIYLCQTKIPQILLKNKYLKYYIINYNKKYMNITYLRNTKT